MCRFVALLAVASACSFSPGTLRIDASGAGDDATDASMIDGMPDAAIDAMPDASPPSGFVRAIDLIDAQVSGGPHVDFPLLVGIQTQAWLRSATNGGDVARDDGFDIFFSSDQLGVTRLAFEVEAYDPVNGTLIAWVKVPALIAATIIYLHYGDSAITTSQEQVAQVWTAGYELVAHLEGGPDATGKNTLTGAGLLQANGIGLARDFDGDASNLGVGSQTAIDDVFLGGGSIEGWFFADTFGEGTLGRLFDKKATLGYALSVDNTNVSDGLTFFAGCTTGNLLAAWAVASIPNATGAWHHVVVNYDSTTTANDPSFYVDGMLATSSQIDSCGGATVSDAAQELDIGNNGAAGTRGFDGRLDEMRASSVTRSADWILTQYRSHNDPTMFYTVGNPL